MPRKLRTDSIRTQVEMAAAKLPSPPPHVKLRKGDEPFWNSIVRAKEYNSWTEADLECAVHLARTKADIERYQAQLDSEGPIVVNRRGTQIANPLNAVLETLSRRMLALTRALQVDALSTGGAEPVTRQKRNQLQREMVELNKMPEDDGLLASPKH